MTLALSLLACADMTGELEAGDKSESGLLSATDITFLYPLPSLGDSVMTAQGVMELPRLLEEAGYLVARSEGSHGPLLASDLLDGLPAGTGMSYWGGTIVVGARIDPCAPPSCEAQVRFVLQAIFPGSVLHGQPIHAIYALPGDELRVLVDGLVALKAAHQIDTHGVPVGVHPALAPLGAAPLESGASPVAPDFARELRALLLRHVGTGRLIRVAARDFGMVATTDAEGRLVGSVFHDGVVYPPEPITSGVDAGRVRVHQLVGEGRESYVTDGLFAEIPSCRVPITDPSTADDYVAFGIALVSFDVVDGQLVRDQIARLKESEASHCQLVTGAGADEAMSEEGIAMAPLPWPELSVDEDIAPVFSRGTVGDESRMQSPEAIAAAADRVTDPSAHDITNIDCASCHLTGLSRRWVERFHAGAVAPFDLPLSRADGVLAVAPSFTCLGYEPFGPVVCDRVLLETELSLEQLTGSR